MTGCKNCNDEGWVCENHPHVPWEGGAATCCADDPPDDNPNWPEWKCGAGAPCPVCNPCDKDNWPRMPPETKIVYDKDGYRH